MRAWRRYLEIGGQSGNFDGRRMTVPDRIIADNEIKKPLPIALIEAMSDPFGISTARSKRTRYAWGA